MLSGTLNEGRGLRAAPLASIGLAALASLLFLLPALAERLELDRLVFETSEWWRLMSGHLVHFDFQHFAVDTLTLLLLGSACELIDAKRARWTLALSALTVSVGVVLFASDIETYRGLSGIDSALFTFLGVHLWRRNRQRGGANFAALLGLLSVALFIGKICFETTSGGSLFTPNSAFVSVPIAHLVGGLTGLVVGARLLEFPERAPTHPARPYLFSKDDYLNEVSDPNPYEPLPIARQSRSEVPGNCLCSIRSSPAERSPIFRTPT